MTQSLSPIDRQLKVLKMSMLVVMKKRIASGKGDEVIATTMKRMWLCWQRYSDGDGYIERKTECQAAELRWKETA